MPTKPKPKLPTRPSLLARPERQPKIVATTQRAPVNQLAAMYGVKLSPEVAASATSQASAAHTRVAPYYENQLDLPSYLEQIAAEMRAGTWSPVSEACLLFKDMASEDPAVITVLRWGENDGLMDTETVAALGGRTGMVQ